MSRYLLDTNALSELIKNPQGSVATKARSLSPEQLCTSMIVASELRYGVVKKASPILFGKVENLLERIEVLPFGGGADRHYGRLRAELEDRGQVIGGNDMLIAAHALSVGCILVTANVRELSRIHGLTIENWEHPTHVRHHRS